MSAAQRLNEISPDEPLFVDSGPHSLHTSVAANPHGATLRILLTDKTGSGPTDGEIVYHALIPTTVYKAGFVSLGAISEVYTAAGWTALGGSPSVAFSATVVDGEIVIEALLRDDYSVEASFHLSGVIT